MAIIKNIDQLKPLVETGKALQKMNEIALSGGAPVDDFWSRLERIIPSLDHLLDTALKVKQGNQEPAGQTRQVLTEPHTAANNIAITEKPAEKAKGNNTEMNKILQAFLVEFKSHLAACIKENPNMTIGECIAKMDFATVTQIAVLLQLAEKFTKGG